MSNKKQTAVEWLFKELLNSEPNILEWNKLLEQAKAMEKDMITSAFNEGQALIVRGRLIQGQQYYAETYEQ